MDTIGMSFTLCMTFTFAVILSQLFKETKTIHSELFQSNKEKSAQKSSGWSGQFLYEFALQYNHDDDFIREEYNINLPIQFFLCSLFSIQELHLQPD
jgi:hypothetical protein